MKKLKVGTVLAKFTGLTRMKAKRLFKLAIDAKEKSEQAAKVYDSAHDRLWDFIFRKVPKALDYDDVYDDTECEVRVREQDRKTN